MTHCRIAYLDTFEDSKSQNKESPSDAEIVHYSSMSIEDEIRLLKELFFESKVTSRTDWRDLCLERRHDFKFWALITHNFGFSVLKCVFNIGTAYEDQCITTKYLVKSEFGNELCTANSYISSLKNEVAFHLLSGMIENRLPGSLRLIIRGNGYQFFENRINELLNSSSIDSNAICHNINAIITLFPYLTEYKLNLGGVCHRLTTSRFWRYIWSTVGLQIINNDVRHVRLFIKFIDLVTVFLYGSRCPGFLKRLHSSPSYLWSPIFSLLLWDIDHEVLSTLVVFTADILLLSISDRCISAIPTEYFDNLRDLLSEAIEKGRLTFSNNNDKIAKNEFAHYHAKHAYNLVNKLHKIISKPKDMKKHLYNNVDALYDISSLSSSRMTIPFNCIDLCDVIPDGSPKGFGNKIFPRILPCFNGGCGRVFHMDIPEIHVKEEEDLNFFYCPECGIPSYCSIECSKAHWAMSHKELCSYFRAFPTFVKYQPSSSTHEPMLSTLDHYTFKSDDEHGTWKLTF